MGVEFGVKIIWHFQENEMSAVLYSRNLILGLEFFFIILRYRPIRRVVLIVFVLM